MSKKTKESFVFYRSFFEAISLLPEGEQLTLFKSICEMALNETKPELEGTSLAMYKLIEPQLLANNRRYKNACKGGRPKNQTETKPKPKSNQSISKPKPNENVNVNVNKNEKENGQGLDALKNAIDFPGNYPEKLDDYLNEKPW